MRRPLRYTYTVVGAPQQCPRVYQKTKTGVDESSIDIVTHIAAVAEVAAVVCAEDDEHVVPQTFRLDHICDVADGFIQEGDHPVDVSLHPRRLVPANGTMSHRNVQPHVSIKWQAACYRLERTLMGCADPPF